MRAKALAEAERRRRARQQKNRPFAEIVQAANSFYTWHEPMRLLAGQLERVAAGEVRRLAVFMPPRHGKSELISRLFPSLFLFRHPRQFVGLASYAAELAYSLSRNARDYYRDAGGKLKADAAAVKQWETLGRGGLWAAGVGGPILGKGYHCGIIDDPIKNAEEAHSATVRQRNADWYDSTWSSRREPDAAEVLVMQRWHHEDLAAHILGKGLRWTVLHFPALAEPREAVEEIYSDYNVELIPDPRPVGAALIPARYNEEALAEIKTVQGPYFWASMYQQRPAPREGGMFKRADFRLIEHLPDLRGARFVRYWDKAGTDKRQAQGRVGTASILMARTRRGDFLILDRIIGQWGAVEREEVISQTLRADAANYGRVITYVEQEPGSGGKESAEATIRRNAGFVVRADRVTGDKVLRAEPFAAQVAAGNVSIIIRTWVGDYLENLTAFPNGIKDDTDASSGAFNMLAVGGSGGPPPAEPDHNSRWKKNGTQTKLNARNR